MVGSCDLAVNRVRILAGRWAQLAHVVRSGKRSVCVLAVDRLVKGIDLHVSTTRAKRVR